MAMISRGTVTLRLRMCRPHVCFSNISLGVDMQKSLQWAPCVMRSRRKHLTIWIIYIQNDSLGDSLDFVLKKKI